MRIPKPLIFKDRCASDGVHRLYLVGVQRVDNGTAKLERVGELARLYAELAWQQGELLYFLESGQSFLQTLDALGYEIADFSVLHKFLKVVELDFMLAGIFL